MLQARYNYLAIGILAVYLFVGIWIYKDYGIGYDDSAQRLIGEINYDWVHKKNDALLTFSDRYYGPVYEVSLLSLERAFGAKSGKEIYEIRHIANFIHYWLSVMVFWLLLSWIFKNSFISLIGMVFLVLSPRFFAESFYNTKDIPLMSAYIFSFAAFARIIQKPTPFRIGAFAAISAYTTAIRPFGLFFPLLYGYYLLTEALKMKTVRILFPWAALYLLIYLFFLFLFWPILRNDPMQFFLMLRESAKHFDQPVYYFGSFISSANKPWHYLPIFIIITTPPFITILGVTGAITMLCESLRRRATMLQKTIHYGILLWLTIPITMVYMLNPRIYDGWRHLYFVYPAIIIISLVPIKKLLDMKINQSTRAALTIILIISLSLHIGTQIWFIIKSHPYQNIYFSLWVKNLKTASQLFDFDYWGLSEPAAIRFILHNDRRPVIKIYFTDTPGLVHSLTTEELERIHVSDGQSNPDYVITQYRWEKSTDIPGFTRVHTIAVDGAVLTAIYKNNSIN